MAGEASMAYSGDRNDHKPQAGTAVLVLTTWERGGEGGEIRRVKERGVDAIVS